MERQAADGEAGRTDTPMTVTVARAVRTGMVKMEQVYSPSSES